MHIKAIIKTAFNWLQPEWYQTNDNNIDLINQYDNEKLTDEFVAISENLRQTRIVLEKYEFYRELKKTGLTISKKEMKRRAEIAEQQLIDCNLIQNGLLVPGILEVIKEESKV